MILEDEWVDMIVVYYKWLFSGNCIIEVVYVCVWVVWENVLVLVYFDGSIVMLLVEYVYVFLCFENYYFINVGFFE